MPRLGEWTCLFGTPDVLVRISFEIGSTVPLQWGSQSELELVRKPTMSVLSLLYIRHSQQPDQAPSTVPFLPPSKAILKAYG